jgi:hypothetical protein
MTPGPQVALVLQTIANQSHAARLARGADTLQQVAHEVLSMSVLPGRPPTSPGEVARLIAEATSQQVTPDEVLAAAYERPALPAFLTRFMQLASVGFIALGAVFAARGALLDEAERVIFFIAGGAFVVVGGLVLLMSNGALWRWSYRRQIGAQLAQHPEQLGTFLQVGAGRLLARRVPGIAGSGLEVPIERGMIQWVFGLATPLPPEDARITGPSFRILLALAAAASAQMNGARISPLVNAYLEHLEAFLSRTFAEVASGSLRPTTLPGASAIESWYSAQMNMVWSTEVYSAVLINTLAEQAVAVGLIAAGGGRHALHGLFQRGPSALG